MSKNFKSIDEYIFFQLSRSGSKCVLKKDLVQYATSKGVEIPPKTTKDQLVHLLIDAGYQNDLVQTFMDGYIVPIWYVGDFYNMSSSSVKTLMNLGVIRDKFIMKEGWSKKHKDSTEYEVFEQSVLSHDAVALHKAIEDAYGNWLRVRVMCKTEEEFDAFNEVFSKIFETQHDKDCYENRNNDGLRYYFKARVVTGSMSEENKYLAEIERLNNKIDSLQKKLDSLYKEMRESVYLTNEEYDKLTKSAQEYKEIKAKQHKAGRKKSFDDQDVLTMKKLRNDGLSYQKIADEFLTSKKTVMRYLNRNDTESESNPSQN